jgi:hypothetical protein
MPTNICPISWQRERCQDVRCRLRYGIGQSKPYRRVVLHERPTRGRRGEEHRQFSRLPERKARASSSAFATPRFLHRRINRTCHITRRKPGCRRISTDGRGQRSRERALVVSEENGLTLRSTTIQGRVFTTPTAPIVIKRVMRNDSLMLSDVKVTGAESRS